MKATGADVEVLVPKIERRVTLEMTKKEADALARAIERALPEVKKAGYSLDVERLRGLFNGIVSASLGSSACNEFEVDP